MTALVEDGTGAVLDLDLLEELVRRLGPEPLSRLCQDDVLLAAAIDGIIADLDREISEYLDRVMHHEEFRRLEGRWRGLQWLVEQIDGPQMQRIRLLSITRAELSVDLELQEDFRRSELYHKIHQMEFNTAGGTPFGLLLVDYEASHLPLYGDDDDDAPLEPLTLTNLARIAKASWAPVVVGAAPRLLTVDPADGFGGLSAVSDPSVVFEMPEYAAWRALRKEPESRFLSVVLPRLLARPPWRDRADSGFGFRYDEHAPGAGERVWMSAAYAFAAVVLRAVGQFGWPADIRGADTGRIGGGVVTDLPMEPFSLGAGFTLPRVPVDVAIREHQERNIASGRETGLIAAGLIPLVALPLGDEPAFGATRSLHQPETSGRGNEAALANSKVAAQMNAVLCAARFAHTAKKHLRDSVGSTDSAQAIEQRLRGWLSNYVNKSISPDARLRAQRPLANAQVKVTDVEGRPGTFSCVMHFQPYFQLDTLDTTMQFETELGSDAPADIIGIAS